MTCRPGIPCTNRPNAGLPLGCLKPSYMICGLCCGRPKGARNSLARLFDSRTLQSTPESGERAGYDGAKRKKGSKTHIAVDTLGHLLALLVTSANEQDRAQVEELAHQVQEVSEQSVQVAFVDQGYTGEEPAQAAQQQGIQLQVVKLPEAKKGFVLLPRRWVVERSFGWAARFRRLACDYERLPEILKGLTFPAFAMLMLKNFVHLMALVL